MSVSSKARPTRSRAKEKLAHLAAADAREELQCRHAQNAADKDSDAERQAAAAYGEALPQASPSSRPSAPASCAEGDDQQEGPRRRARLLIADEVPDCERALRVRAQV